MITVLIPSRDRPTDLLRCVESVLRCDHPCFEVIVVEQGSQTSSLPADDRLRHVASETVGKSAGLNEGVALSRGSLLAFTDDDCTVPVDWLSKAEAVFQAHPEVGMVFGSLEAIGHDPTEVFIPEFLPTRFEVMSRPAQAIVRGGAGANMFLRREVVDRIFGFDERIGPGSEFRSCEEFDVYYRVLRAGYPVARDPGNAVLHWGSRTYSDGSGQRLLRGYYYGEGVVLGKHVRCRDPQALILASKIAIEQVKTIADCLVRTRRLTGLGRGAYWLRGFATGLSTRVNRPARLFTP